MNARRIGIVLLAAAASLGAARAQNTPHLEKRGQVTQLMLDGKPFLVLGGEVHNSSSSNLDYMKGIWPRLAQMHLNTVLTPVSWEQFEPAEGKYNFALVDGLLADARRQNLHLILLWMGSWKNSTSRYAADWVKANEARFPRVRNAAGQPLEILSVFNPATRDADTRAYVALLKHLREADARQHTVLMIQLQNEVGVLGDSRDHGDAANAAFNQPVPAELLDYFSQHPGAPPPVAPLKPAGTWAEVFGATPAADEIFMAWNYAKYMGAMAAAGKAEYPLPVFVNAWIIQPQDKGPGDYPSGGPQAHVHPIWRAGAPAIDILAPDIYLPDFPAILASYERNGNPPFIPESRGGAGGVANAFYAIGQFGAIGYSPFGIDGTQAGPPVSSTSASVFSSLSSGPAGYYGDPLSTAYGILGSIAPLVLEHQADGTIAGVWLNGNTTTQSVTLGNYTLNFEMRRARRAPGNADAPAVGAGLVIALGPDEYLVAGMDVQVTFAPREGGPAIAGPLSVEEGEYVKGEWVPGRRLNGDEVQLRYDLSAAAAEGQSGAGLRFTGGPSLQRVKLYRYK